ncbi:DUF1707 SHOCT-like domain-containing protein [Actinomycetospora aeridis]|uniref:DUF1707 domain-containing protein n=1 Tax=Actinomycetospora aeridis TaxID=3129231 RepID=A0ABU8MXU4_9PSEU
MDTDDPHTGDESARQRPAGRAGLRVGDADRGAALDALGEHLAAGRLDVDEFGDRSAHAAVAVYRADLEVLFDDLPAPHPPLPQPPPSPVPSPRVDHHPASRERRGHHPVPAPAVGAGIAVLVLMLMPVLLIGAATTGSVGGLLVLPLLFVVLGHVGHARRRRW